MFFGSRYLSVIYYLNFPARSARAGEGPTVLGVSVFKAKNGYTYYVSYYFFDEVSAL